MGLMEVQVYEEVSCGLVVVYSFITPVKEFFCAAVGFEDFAFEHEASELLEAGLAVWERAIPLCGTPESVVVKGDALFSRLAEDQCADKAVAYGKATHVLGGRRIKPEDGRILRGLQ